MTNEKIEIVAEIESADNEIVNNEIPLNKNADAEIAESKSSTPGLPDYDQATENQTKNAEEGDIPEFRSETPTKLFVATESTVEPFAQPTQPVTNQPQIVQPVGNHVRVHPAPVVAVVSSNPPPIHTSCCECDGPWCGYCCCGVCCHICTGFSLNQKLNGSMCMWQLDLILFILCAIMCVVSIIIAASIPEFICGSYNCYWVIANGKVWTTISFVCAVILMVLSIFRIYTRFAQRRLFMRNQAEKGHYPNNEGCIISFLGSWFCSPCLFGQMNSAIEKQRFLSLVQPQHTVSYNV